MAKHKCSLYTRSSTGARTRQPAYPGATYSAGTIFQIRYAQHGKRIWKTLSATTYPEALVQAKMQETELFQRDLANYTVSSRGIKHIAEKPAFVEAVAPDVLPEPQPLVKDSLGAAMENYLAELAVRTSRPGSVAMFASVFRQFYASATKNGSVARSLKSITKADLVKFAAYWQTKGQAEVTIHNKITVIACLLKANEIHNVRLKIKFTPREVTSFSQQEIKQLFAVATPQEKLLFSFFLCSGLRKSEVRFATWAQLDLDGGVYTVRETKLFKPKSRKPRYIPLPGHLLAQLKELKLSSKNELIFPGATGKPNSRIYEHFRALAQRAGLPCHGVHAWRRSFATMLSRNGEDLRTIQGLLGHAEIGTTERYLVGQNARSAEAQARANATFPASYA